MTGLFPPLPVFIDLTGRAVVLLSGDVEAAAVARRLLDAGAGVTVIHPAPGVEIAALAPAARLLARRWRTADLAGAALVIAAGGDRRRARIAARAARALFLALNDPEHSDIQLGSSLAQGPLAFGVAAAGAAPVIGDVVVRRLEAFLPPGYGQFLEAAGRAAAEITTAYAGETARDAFWRATAEAAFDHARVSPQTDWDRWLADRLAPR
jgi:uroporphyrin-III C-methyltransferase/precorrin-2 dehydrogenase/sirohydrochlorin ferrochelatase